MDLWSVHRDQYDSESSCYDVEDQFQQETGEGTNISCKFQCWSRGPPPKINTETPMVVFVTDSVTTLNDSKNLTADDMAADVIHLFGLLMPEMVSGTVSEAQTRTSVCVHVRGFQHYFYAVPTDDWYDKENNYFYMHGKEFLSRINKLSWEEIMDDPKATPKQWKFYLNGNSPVTCIQSFKMGDIEDHIFQFHCSKSVSRETLLLKIFVSSQSYLKHVARVVQRIKTPCTFTVFEQWIKPSVRYFRDMNLYESNWVQLKGGKFAAAEKKSSCQIEVEVNCNDIEPFQQEILPTFIPLRILSFDIETKGLQENCAVIQIGVILKCLGETGERKCVFTLGGCSEIENVEVVAFGKDTEIGNVNPRLEAKLEAQLIAGFFELVKIADPDIITGYNIMGFDLLHLLKRAQKLALFHPEVANFRYFGRIDSVPAIIKYIRNDCEQFNAVTQPPFKVVNVPGFLVFDMFYLTKREYPLDKMKGWKLGNVAPRLLGKGAENCKIEVKPERILELYKTSNTTRKKLAEYCIQDAKLALRLLLCDIKSNSKFRNVTFLDAYMIRNRVGHKCIRYGVSLPLQFNEYIASIFASRRAFQNAN